MTHFTDVERLKIIMERERGKISGGKSTGRPKSLNGNEIKKLDDLSKRKPTATATVLENDISQVVNKLVSIWTIRRYRRALGYRPYKQVVKTSLTPAQQQSKLLFAQIYINTDIKNWLFTDENMFTIKSAGTIAWGKAGTERPTHYVDNIKAHVQVWGVMWWSGKVFSRYDGYMNSSLYQQLLTIHLLPHISNHRNRLFYQDNIPLHKTSAMLTWFKDNRLELIDVPGYSPEFDAIEYVWSWLKNYV
ncbi:unnamed protein product [Rotaria magnacalcarata]|uniref:Transposase n=1 Tax=Rotaria magnacalcarata TaxID=392030 RepID=A0A816M9B5_9BILA|nr:unnamed protein product [Rotaria magnacalcarata]CAF1389078.1 unnamed protein product [Rotaria magnacalcarata]CAF1968703.1 unnamed protein product [Rotaria magnacalcarata]CAF3869402.1 unnamed protein product [Rotaria magnacalcarata]CAF4122551.1 unnamed protein product [Rotaria magnacalcarata]